MEQRIEAHFDGKVIIPDGPCHLPIGRRLRVRVELAELNTPRFAELLDFATDLEGSPTDLAAQHDHYLYGTPKH